MDAKDKEISQLKKLVKKLRNENDYLKSPMYLYDVTEQIQGKYSILLNPPSLDLRTTKGQKAAFFKINVNDIICVTTDGKSKWIHFKCPQTSYDGIKLTSEKLAFTGSLEEFCLKYDSSRIHLCIVSRFSAINLFYYNVDKDQLILNDDLKANEICHMIALSPQHRGDFITRKEITERLVSFQKIQIHSK